MSITASQLYKKISKYDSLVSNETIKKAYTLSKKAHSNQFRGNGDEYFTHPLAVANFLTEMKLDSSTIITALLHDVVEDCEISLKEVKKLFGKNVSNLVNGVTKLLQLDEKLIDQGQAEYFQKMALATAEDVRVVIIKLADRLHNLKTIEHLPRDKQIKKSKETLELYAPLALSLIHI